MKVFISYSTALDQIMALRLQTMAAVYGMTVYVPPASTRSGDNPTLSPEVSRHLHDSDVVLAVVTHQPTPSALSEMNYTLALPGKLLIPIVSDSVPPEFLTQFGKYFVVNPEDPSKAEQEIVKFLAGRQQAKTGGFALVALATLAVALLLFNSDPR